MASTYGSFILASDFLALKARVKAEMLRRNGPGSLVGYAGAGYDYTPGTGVGSIIKTELYNKIIDPMKAINPGVVLVENKSIGQFAIAFSVLEAQMTSFESFSGFDEFSYENVSDCVASCSGVCFTTCSGGCGDSCGGECSNDCEGDCANSCYDSCGGGSSI